MSLKFSKSGDFGVQSANNFHAGSCEHIFLMWRVGEFAGQVLTGEMKILVHVQPPFWAIGDIVDDAFVSNEFACAAFTCVAAEFHLCDDVVRDVHYVDYK